MRRSTGRSRPTHHLLAPDTLSHHKQRALALRPFDLLRVEGRHAQCAPSLSRRAAVRHCLAPVRRNTSAGRAAACRGIQVSITINAAEGEMTCEGLRT